MQQPFSPLSFYGLIKQKLKTYYESEVAIAMVSKRTAALRELTLEELIVREL